MRTIICNDLDEAIHEHEAAGFRLEMIRPAHEPREAVVFLDRERLRLTINSGTDGDLMMTVAPPAYAGDSAWTLGRAGMMYRDLTPEHLQGKLIASQIRMTDAGEVPDYVHYHKIHFQMIYCLRGRIRVVYEDQGPAFWLETGDCVLQPPEIRHRVLECTAGAEVIEVSIPAEHETWVEHDIILPTTEIRPDRDFNGQLFVRHLAADAEWDPSDVGDRERDLGISSATNGMVQARVVKDLHPDRSDPESGTLVFPLDDSELLVISMTGI